MLKNEHEYVECGDGLCKLTEKCLNFGSEYCFVCIHNTGAAPRNCYEGE